MGTDPDRVDKLLDALVKDTYTDGLTLAPAGTPVAGSEDLQLVRATLHAQIGISGQQPTTAG